MSWRLDRGALGVIVGPSGSGKSRLLRLLDRLQDPSGGAVRIDGRDVGAWEVRALRAHVGLVPQRPVLASGPLRASLEQPVALGLIDEARLRERLPEALAIAQVPASLLDRDAAEASGGERARIAIARALLLDPRVLALDEPTAALDPPTAAALLDGLDRWRGPERVVLLVTHRTGEVARRDGRLLVLIDGRVEAEGAIAEVLAAPPTEGARAFLAAAGHDAGRATA